MKNVTVIVTPTVPNLMHFQREKKVKLRNLLDDYDRQIILTT